MENEILEVEISKEQNEIENEVLLTVLEECETLYVDKVC